MARKYLCLDVGERRVGIAVGDSELHLAWPHTTIINDGNFAKSFAVVIDELQATDIVVGKPRNQRGEATSQTKFVEEFVRRNLTNIKLPIHWQDESVTSVMAEQQLKASGKQYSKEDIDAQAAAIILQDFLEVL